jgi:hypothetical protein
MLLLIGVAFAQPPGNTEIRLKPSAIIGGVVVGDTLYTYREGPVSFPLEFVNRDMNSYSSESPFRIYSPDGATWEHPTSNGGNYKGFTPAAFGVWIDTTGLYPKSDFGALYRFNGFGCDGVGADTFNFVGAANDVSQLAIRPSDSGIFFYAVIRPKLADEGKHICIDSSWRPPAGVWKWPSFNVVPSYITYPKWNGPYCYVLGGCCRGLTGNYDCSPDDNVDIADISAAVDRYTTLAMPCCPAEANVDGSPDGVADISDLTRLIDYLYIRFTPPAPCQ